MRKLLIFAIILTLCACNDDIFLDHPIKPSVDEITIDGDGGTASFTFCPENLKSVFLDTDGSVTEIDRSEFVYSQLFNSVKIKINGNCLNVESIGNASGQDISYYLTFDYGFVSESVKINILAGKLPVVSEVRYDTDRFQLNVTPVIRHQRLAYSNNSDSPIAIDINPLRNSKSTALVKLDEWDIAMPAKISLPIFLNGDWTLDKQETELTLNQSFDYSPDMETSPYYLNLQPQQSVIVEISVSYYKVRLPISINFYAGYLQQNILFKGMIYVTQPTDFKIETVWDSLNSND